MIFALVVIPFIEYFIQFIEQFLSWVFSLIELKKGKISVQIAQMNKEISRVEEASSTSVIGFTIPDEEEDAIYE